MTHQLLKAEQLKTELNKEMKKLNEFSIANLYGIIDNVYETYTEKVANGVSFNCTTGNKDYLVDKLINAFDKAESIDIIVSFIMETGVRLIGDALKRAADRGVKIRILTGNYLKITQPSALYLLRTILGDKVDLRMYNIENKSFHPKAYICEYKSDGEIFLGSSNISASALTSGIEWNYEIKRLKNERDYEHLKGVFEDIFNNYAYVLDDDQLEKYSRSWVKPKIPAEMEILDIDERGKLIEYPQPRGAQIEALYQLKLTREEDLSKALVVAATGIGKTYLAAFDSNDFSKILYVAHREEILSQAMETFKTVRQRGKYGFFNSERKDTKAEVIFASVQSLGKPEYLREEYFSRNEFDYIIIDEFHHAAAGNYTNIINYFRPKFLLGLTATPERLDNKDVFALCDYNVVYEARLRDAINKGWLVPFRYYGIYDEINYDNVEYKNGKYNEKQLEEALMIHKRANLILEHYKKYKSKRTLGFCSSKKHAEYMAKYFNENGVKACAVYSGEKGDNTLDRKEALAKLNSGKLNVVFSVDMFNEGLDIPSVDMVMFLKPTESPTIFLQQLGRGLRKTVGKKYLIVLDFIGNYKKVNLIPFFLTGDIGKYRYDNRERLPREEDYPDECIIEFDLKVIDIFKKQEKLEAKVEELIREDYFRVKEFLGVRPLRLNMFTYMDNDIFEMLRKKSKFNIFNDYLEFLDKIGELNDKEKEFKNTKGYRFINCIENTQMSRSYKMPLLLAFYNEGNIIFKLSQSEICESFMSFYNNGTNGIDLLQDAAGQNYKDWTSSSYLKVAKNPQDAFLNSVSDFFYKDGEYFCLSDDLQEYKDNKWFITNFKDIIEYKTRNYYKTRLFYKYSKDKIEIKYALRDEKVNIFAMTQGGLPGKYPNQIFICKKEPIPENRKIFLLDPKRTAANYSLSEVGKRYAKRIVNMEYDYSYVAIVESQKKIKITEEVFKTLYEKDFFPLWEPEAPCKYFKGKDDGYLVLFRVYKIEGTVDEEVLEKGRSGRNYFYGVSGVVESRLVNPVVSDEVFRRMKEELLVCFLQ